MEVSKISIKKNKNVVMVVYSHFETDSRVKREAQSLAKNGYNVFCISLKDKEENKTIKYGANITILKIMPWLNRLEKGTFLRYLIGCTIFWFVSFITLLKISLKRKIHYIHIHNPPDHLSLMAIPFRVLHKSKVILDRHEPFAIHFISKIGFSMNSIVFSFLLAYEKLSYKFVDAIITINEIESKDVKEIIRGKKITVIKNSFDISSFKIHQQQNQITRSEENWYILYQGIISEKRDIDTIIYAIKKAQKTIHNLKCYIIGTGDFLEEAINLTKKLYVEELFVFSKKWIKQNELMELMNKANVFLLTLKDIPVYHRAAPNKLFEYMYVQKPIIAADLPTIRKLTENKCSYYKPGDANDLEEKIVEIWNKPELRSKMVASYNDVLSNNIWSIEEESLFKLYLDLQ